MLLSRQSDISNGGSEVRPDGRSSGDKAGIPTIDKHWYAKYGRSNAHGKFPFYFLKFIFIFFIYNLELKRKFMIKKFIGLLKKDFLNFQKKSWMILNFPSFNIIFNFQILLKLMKKVSFCLNSSESVYKCIMNQAPVEEKFSIPNLLRNIELSLFDFVKYANVWNFFSLEFLKFIFFRYISEFWQHTFIPCQKMSQDGLKNKKLDPVLQLIGLGKLTFYLKLKENLWTFLDFQIIQLLDWFILRSYHFIFTSFYFCFT